MDWRRLAAPIILILMLRARVAGAVDVPPVLHLLAPDHPMAEVEKRALAAKLPAIEQIVIEEQDTEEEVFYKLRLAFRLFRADEGQNYHDLLYALYDLTLEAYRRYPVSAPIVCLYGYADAGEDPADLGLIALVENVEHIDSCPGIALALYRTFWTMTVVAHEAARREGAGQSTDGFGDGPFVALGDDWAESARKSGALLWRWGNHVHRLYGPEHRIKAILPASPEHHDELRARAREAWRDVLMYCGIKLAEERLPERLSEKARREAAERAAAQRREIMANIQRQLRGFGSLQQAPNALEELEQAFSTLRMHGKVLEKEHPRIPNYDAISKKLGEAEADVADVFYKAGVRFKREMVMEQVDKLLAKYPDDVRLLILASRLTWAGHRYDEALGYLERVLELDPENERALSWRGRLQDELERRR